MSSIIYPITNLKATEQLVIDRGEGAYVYDKSGKQYLEGLAGLWCTSLGYGNEELIETIATQTRKLSFCHMFGGKTHEAGMQLSDTLAQMVPMDNARVFFGNSGSDANDTQIKLLRYYFNAIGKPEKRKIITRERAYHGVTVAAGSLTSLPVNISFFDPPVEALGILRTDHPHYYRGRLEGESETAFVDRITHNLEQLILREGPATIAAFIAEPITGASGVIVPPPGYYEKVRAILDKYDILFWADEVITGFGRTGSDFGCNSMHIERPDMMSFAKQLSSAYYPISAALIRGDMYEAMVEQSTKVGVFGHGYTYSGHPVACAVAGKVLEIYQRDKLFEHAATTGAYLQNRLAELAEHPLVGEVRGKGLIGAVELVADKASAKPFDGPDVINRAALQCQENGLLVRPVAGTSLAMCPPLIITREQIDELIAKLSQSLDETLGVIK
ncbi:aminotransferase class III-fold pyridoxal phosphate-dependent enzyme [Exilibacterium tricleocarpae]|uniref:Aminotransferase class III-fold pyridoxal phosphate-dependent enzyme n=1 Tax=Exilibacterium tricleocarpae TaxID=2591008 RepID=A0A545T0D1_9GAMM|nr:aminotransferase [Exilibacterium tricleocarpae]TQV70675.1 aminotransferase class III-fold pyridoxal phosphate-dependent enzyme [Exilibacterium tricleocarpae]